MSILINSRSYRGTLVNSDHRVVITKIDLGTRFKLFKKPKMSMVRYDSCRLTADKSVQLQYQGSVAKTNYLNSS